MLQFGTRMESASELGHCDSMRSRKAHLASFLVPKPADHGPIRLDSDHAEVFSFRRRWYKPNPPSQDLEESHQLLSPEISSSNLFLPSINPVENPIEAMRLGSTKPNLGLFRTRPQRLRTKYSVPAETNHYVGSISFPRKQLQLANKVSYGSQKCLQKNTVLFAEKAVDKGTRCVHLHNTEKPNHQSLRGAGQPSTTTELLLDDESDSIALLGEDVPRVNDFDQFSQANLQGLIDRYCENDPLIKNRHTTQDPETPKFWSPRPLH